MTAHSIFQVDAFTDKVFKGNPAGVCPIYGWLADDLMSSIARENNLSETAFVNLDQSPYGIRWFTPKYEVELCGHATLAAAKFETKLVAREDESAWVSAEVIKVAAPASSDAGMMVVKTTVAARRAVASDVTEAPCR